MVVKCMFFRDRKSEGTQMTKYAPAYLNALTRAAMSQQIKVKAVFSFLEHETQKLHYHDDNLVSSVINLFGAGTDTTSNTLCWSLLYMAKYPQIQGALHETNV